MSVHEEARRLLAAGISVIPIVLGGDKRPPVAWEPYQSRLATDDEAAAWWAGSRPYGIAAVCGKASGGLEVIDFDREAEALYKEWCSLVEESCPGLLERLIAVRTPRRPSGMHVWFRCRATITPGNMKLAIDPTKSGKERTLVETRGEGGYALVPGGPDGVHENGKPYEYLADTLADVPDITADDREFLILAARSLTREAARTETTPKSWPGSDLRPGDDYDRRADWGDILRNAGWTEASRKGEEIRWRRPGKGRCWSATTGVCKGADGTDLLRVFSSSCHPLEDGKAYGKFRFLVLTEFGGDMSRAASFLRTQGYGTPGNPHAKAKAKTAGEEPAEDFAAQFKDRRVATTDDLEKAGAEVEWVWPGWLATKVVCAMAAEAGRGKTRFVADLVRRIRQGLPWPDGQPMTLRSDSKVMWVVADNHHDQMVAIAREWGIRENVVFNAWANEPYEGTSLESDEDFKLLDLRVKMAKPALVVVDTVGNATDRNMGRQEDARAFYLPLQVMARKRRCCVFALTHLNTSGQILGKRAKEKVRVVVSLDRPDPADERLALSVSKTFARPPKALGVKLTDGGYEYDPDPPVAPPTEPGMEGFGRTGRGRPATAAAQVCAWLRARLAKGPVLAAKVIDEAVNVAGFAKPTVFRAREIVADQTGEPGHYFWQLRASAEEAPLG